MASKGPRSKLDHETRARRQKALEAPKEPRRPKTHWDHVLEEMVWLSKDFESERKWKLAQAKKVALKASKGMLDQATRGERKLKEEEQRLRKVALNISKDVKKFWVKIEKLVHYKHQMELDEKKKKTLDKQLEFLLGQTERYSTMLAENLIDSHNRVQKSPVRPERLSIEYKEADENNTEDISDLLKEPSANTEDIDGDYDVQPEEESEDDEHTIEEDEAHITEEERKEELEALRSETDIPLEELLKRYAADKVNRGSTPEVDEDDDGDKLAVVEEDHEKCDDIGLHVGNKIDNLVEDHEKCDDNGLPIEYKMDIGSSLVRRCGESNGILSTSDNHALALETSQVKDSSCICRVSDQQHDAYDFNDEKEDGDFVLATGEENDDETTLLEEEELAKADSNNHVDEVALLQKESEIPLEELLARYKKHFHNDETSDDESQYASALSEDLSDSPPREDLKSKDQDNLKGENVDPSESQLVMHSPAEEQGTESLQNLEEGRESENVIADAAAAARSAQPTGITFSTTQVRTKFPFLLKYPLREYQHIGLDWLVTMYEKRLNGILADEMGLGKTIMTIALLAHLACEKGIWGPHLIVVPTSVMLNWETEFLKWCPAFKILTYFGSAKERKLKRQGWLKPNFFHVCITTYRLVIQDSKIFKRKKWKYLILDEAHLIKNWKSQRWQTLLNFNSKRRILLTGTPLQNDLMELWSLMHFLMPHIFQSHQEFKEWFTNPISGMVEGQEKVNKEVVDRLHNVLRPFILRRLKRDVEKQLPMKHEHVIYCRLSKRQRNLYEDFIASSETQATLASANFFGMISVIMQLRKVCNHPDLFEGRPIVSSFDMGGIDIQLSSSVCSMLSPDPFLMVNLEALGFLFTHLDFSMNSWECDERMSIATPPSLIKERVNRAALEEIGPFSKHRKKFRGTNIFDEIQKALLEERLKEAKDRAASIAWWNSLRCQKKPMYSTSLQGLLTVGSRVSAMHYQKADQMSYLYSSKLADIVLSPTERFERMTDLVESFMFAIPAARAPAPVCWCSKTGASVFLDPVYKKKCSEVLLPLLSPIRPAMVRRQVYFPDRRLIQFDCGKLQELAVLLRKLKSEGHRALIFTQMTKMLDILEAFINLYGYTYMRLDGSTLPEERQTLMQRFNTNPKIFLFILSTRSGGVGINLVGADTVIFYDSDWNPAMDQQAQDRCHRIGQTREVHIYRLISKSTIEENILRKANQKRALDDLVIQSGSYNTEFFKKLDPMELFSGHRTLPAKSMQKEKANNGVEVSLSNADVEAALKSAEDEADYMALKRVEQEEAVDNQEFAEEAIGKLEDDELVNEENVKIDEVADQGGCLSTPKHDHRMMLNGIGPEEERAVTFAAKEDDVDMLADVQQMAAAAAAAGQAILSFDNQLRPIDRYAMRFLELWDPIIDKAAVETEVRFEERDWELDRIEKYKEEMEAEIDEDEEPFVYERWDSDIATEAYRQQVEVLAQHQLMEEMEAEAKEKEDAEKLDVDSIKYERARNPKPKSKKKPKKAKFKSLKRGNLTPESKPVKEELTFETMSIDDDMYDDEATTSDAASPPSSGNKKRKKVESSFFAEKEESGSKKSKKFKKGVSRIFSSDLDSSSRKQNDGSTELRPNNSVVVELEQKSASRGKMGGKISITTMPVKRVLMIKSEKLRKGNIWSRDHIPSPDVWLPQEDSILCAVVHEYGPSWSLVSEILYGMTAGGFYRGRYRHPAHCCERFRELIQRYVLSTPDNPINEKGSGMGSGKALLKVTEDNVRVLLNVAAEQADNELLLQKHFTALLSSVWKMKSPHQKRKNLLSLRNGLFFGGKLFSSFSQTSRNSMNGPSGKMKFTNSGPNSRLLLDALHESSSEHDKGSSDTMEDCAVMSEQIDITLEFPEQSDASSIGCPRVVNLSLHGEDSVKFIGKASREDKHLKDSQSVAEKRFRDAARACDDDNLGWASSSAFPANDPKLRSASKLHSLGKHKISFSDSVRPKSKSKKTSVEHAETVGCLYPEPMWIAATKDPNLRFDFTSDFIHEEWSDDMNGNLLSRMDKHLSFETDSFDIIPHDYSPGLISDLEDYSIWSDHTDIG